MSETTPSMPDDRITIQDIRDCGYCVRGAVTWLAMYGMDFRTFLAEGASVESFQALDDDYARIIVAKHQERVGG